MPAASVRTRRVCDATALATPPCACDRQPRGEGSRHAAAAAHLLDGLLRWKKKRAGDRSRRGARGRGEKTRRFGFFWVAVRRLFSLLRICAAERASFCSGPEREALPDTPIHRPGRNELEVAAASHAGAPGLCTPVGQAPPARGRGVGRIPTSVLRGARRRLWKPPASTGPEGCRQWRHFATQFGRSKAPTNWRLENEQRRFPQ